MVFKTQSYLVQTSLLLVMGLLLPLTTLADGKGLSLTEDRQSTDKQIAEENEQGISEPTLENNFSPEDRARLRKALADYSKSTDPEHHQIELRRKAMKESVENRFNGCDKDNDDSIDREEATMCLPQIARRFNTVDVDEDGVITLDELELAQAKSIERQKAAEAKMEAQKIQEAEAEIKNKAKLKGNKQALNTHKKPAQPSVNLTTEQ
jgi:Ca2+-binding EF-hand superfamily protein